MLSLADAEVIEFIVTEAGLLQVTEKKNLGAARTALLHGISVPDSLFAVLMDNGLTNEGMHGGPHG